ncbi:hypothetical protein BDV96DRAFT_575627 [Lophiotrema nucula]|uniref:Rhodopsin domain-containing protein n=1 Tax=Lophiotrema nucula TaxID=690887 RepID=A0A6A5ZAQ5_9PLEO|nr:hypothetical protein BDV96DRAFT_575627 [Lophiotrema nucula]
MGSNISRPAKYDAPAYGCLITFLVLTTIAIVARGTSRRIAKAPFWADDALAYVAYVSNAASLINQNTMASTGAFDLARLITFSPEDTESFQHRNLASAVLYLVTITCAKLSVLFLYRRIFYVYQGWFRAFWWFNLLVIFPCWAGATLGILIYAQVDTFAFAKPANAYGTSVCALVNALSDMMVLILPISGVVKLQLGRAQKVGIIGLFSLGFLTTLVSLARATLSFHQATHTTRWNPAYEAYNFMMLVAAETSAACLCACIPVARPFLLKAGELASRSINVSSLRALVSKTSLSSQANRSDAYKSMSGDSNKKDTISRTVDVDMDSIPLRQTASANESLERANVLGYAEHREPPATATAWS